MHAEVRGRNKLSEVIGQIHYNYKSFYSDYWYTETIHKMSDQWSNFNGVVGRCPMSDCYVFQPLYVWFVIVLIYVCWN